jgi:hypothetical protein
MSRMFWHEGGVYVFYAESPEPPGPALGLVTLEHDAPVPRQSLGARSHDQHRVAVAVKPISPHYGLPIYGENPGAARKRGNQQQQ